MSSTPHIHPKPFRNQGGYSLLEVLVAGVILIVILNICLSLFISFNRLRHAGEDILDAVAQTITLEDEFRTTLRTAIALPASFKDFQASSNLLIVQHKNGKEMALLGNLISPDTFSIVHWKQINDTWIIRKIISCELKITQVEFQRIKDSLLKLSISIDNEQFPNSVPGTETLYMSLPKGNDS